MPLSQNQRVLRLALERGSKGIDATDFMLPNVADGRSPITRLAARIKDLSDDGIRFEDGGRRNGVKVYVIDRASLVEASKPDAAPAAPETPSPPVSEAPPSSAVGVASEPVPLFDPQPTPVSVSPYHEEAA